MNYRALGNTGMSVSEIGLGGEHLEGKEYPQVESTVQAALAAGVNIIDIFMSEPNVRTNIGRAIRGQREKVIIQGHFRSVWKNGQYGRTLDFEDTKFFFQDLLDRLETTYIDIGMLHMIDNGKDFQAVFEGPIFQYARDLKRQGTIRAIGMSSHNPAIALEAVNQGLIDVLMFSLNPAYDFIEDDGSQGPAPIHAETFEGSSMEGMNPLRRQLYEACEAKGIGITVMKSLGAGILLDQAMSPFGQALTVPQCTHYALTRPGVASVLLGLQTENEAREALAYETLSLEEKDYSQVLAGKPRFSMKGRCMYCNHCLPCPSHIDIAQVNKYLDLALNQDQVPPTVQAHYQSLEHPASQCIQCGSCEKRCPFQVEIIKKMEKAVLIFEN